jgi:hypothetical protein
MKGGGRRVDTDGKDLRWATIFERNPARGELVPIINVSHIY